MTGAAKKINEYLKFAERLADASRAETLSRFRAGQEVFNKAGIWFDPVTDADREAERLQRKMIRAVYPEHGILGEEFGAENEASRWRWVLDPVDGTRAFICGAATWTTLISLEREKTPVLSLIDQPFTDERWVGFEGRTVLHRNKRAKACAASGIRELAKARISTTDPLHTGYFTTAEAAAFSELAAVARVARFSLDAYAYGLLALGEIDLVVEASLQRHDYSALVPVVTGAGGVITDWNGNAPGADERGRVVAAATPELLKQALARLGDL